MRLDPLESFKKDHKERSLNEFKTHLTQYKDQNLFIELSLDDQNRIDHLINSLTESTIDKAFDSIKDCLYFYIIPKICQEGAPLNIEQITFHYNHCRDILDFTLTQTLSCLSNHFPEKLNLFMEQSNLLCDASYTNPKNDEWTPLSKAVKYGLIKVAELLLKLGADPNKKIKEHLEKPTTDENGQSIYTTMIVETESPITLTLRHSLIAKYTVSGIRTDYSIDQPERAREMIDLLLEFKPNLSIKYKSGVDYLSPKDKPGKPLHEVSLYSELNQLIYKHSGFEVDTKTYTVPDFDRYTSDQFNQQFQKMLNIQAGEDIDIKLQEWQNSLILEGVSDEDITMIWNQGPQFAKYFLENFLVLPDNPLFITDYLAHGFMGRHYLSQKPYFKFLEPPNEEFKNVSQLMFNGAPLFQGQVKISYSGLGRNILVGNFLGTTSSKKQQGIIANIIWMGMYCKIHNLRQSQIGEALNKIISKIPLHEATTTTGAQAFPLDENLMWKTDYKVDKQILYQAIGDVIKKFGIIQSPLVLDSESKLQKNPYFVPLETISRLVKSVEDTSS